MIKTKRLLSITGSRDITHVFLPFCRALDQCLRLLAKSTFSSSTEGLPLNSIGDDDDGKKSERRRRRSRWQPPQPQPHFGTGLEDNSRSTHFSERIFSPFFRSWIFMLVCRRYQTFLSCQNEVVGCLTICESQKTGICSVKKIYVKITHKTLPLRNEFFAR